MVQTVGIYPGTFDPIHHGHIAFAEETIKRLALDSVVFLAEPSPRGKENVSTLTDRTLQISDAIAQHQQFRLMSVTSDQFTVNQTLPEIKSAFHDADLVFLIGSDVLFGLRHWDNLKDLAKSARIVIGLRSDCTKEIVDAEIIAIEKLLDISIAYIVIETEHRHISSSQLKRLSGVV